LHDGFTTSNNIPKILDTKWKTGKCKGSKDMDMKF
jgi:hypothetical protein